MSVGHCVFSLLDSAAMARSLTSRLSCPESHLVIVPRQPFDFFVDERHSENFHLRLDLRHGRVLIEVSGGYYDG